MKTLRTMTQERRTRVACLPMLTGAGIALCLAFGSASVAHASTYRVDTSTAATAMAVANDQQCTFAEAILHVNGKNKGVTYCTDLSPGSSEHRIELVEAPNKPYATNHFKITTLTITTSTRLTIAGTGASSNRAVVDSNFGPTSFSAFVIGVKGGGAAQPTVFFDRLTLTNTALGNGGRLIENYGTLQLYGVTIANGDVSGTRHTAGFGGGIYNAGTISFAEGSTLTGNKARKGGAIYNDAGLINELAVTISGNSATLAGGGIYNTTSTPSGVPTNGIIQTYGATITGNKAPAGGGVFNRGTVELFQSVLSGNAATGGNSDEACALGQHCDGSGGGALSAHTVNGPQTRFNIELQADLSTNTATALGGAIYAVGTLDMGGITIAGNSAQNGGVLYYVHSGDSTQSYCNIAADAPGGAYGPTSITGNKASSGGYSIVAGDDDGIVSGTPTVTPVRCGFLGVDSSYMTASQNSPRSLTDPARCDPRIVRSDSHCPQ